MQIFMEHRWYVRKEISLDVQMIQRDMPKLNAKVKNISMGGMFIQTDPVTINEKTLVDVLIYPDSIGENSGIHIKAYVIYKNKKGVGLMFHSYDHVTFEMLSRLCNYRSIITQKTSANCENLSVSQF